MLSTEKSVFSGGYTDNVQDVDMEPHYSPFLRNCRLEWQSIIIRPWHVLLAELTDGSTPKWIGRAPWKSLIVRHNQGANEDLVLIDTDTWAITPINTWINIASDERMHFTNINDVIYTMNGVDPLGKLTGTVHTTPATGIAWFAPKFSVEFNGSHWASTWDHIVRKSVADNYDDFAWWGSDIFTFNETITGLVSHEEALFYFTKNTISKTGAQDIQETAGVVTYFTRHLTTAEGAVNNASIVVADKFIFYVTPSNKIAKIDEGRGENGRDDYILSDRRYRGITRLMQSLDSDQTESFGYYCSNRNLIKWHFKSEWSTFNDVCVVYDITKDAFLVDNNKHFFGGVYSDTDNYTISMLEGKVYRDEFAQDDENQPIAFEYWTKEFYMWHSTFRKILRETRTLTDINELAVLEQCIYIDWFEVDCKIIDKDNIDLSIWGIGTYTVWQTAMGTWSWDPTFEELQEVPIIRTKWNLNLKWRKMQIRFTCNTIAGKARLKDILARYEILPPIANSLTVC